MSLYGALFSGVTALNAQSRSMAGISDNIGNVNTVGYKRVNTEFQTLITSRLTETSFSPGGVLPAIRREVDQQGVITATNSSTDVAISGGGMFVVTDASVTNSSTTRLFTRAGSFRFDQEGYLKNSGGYFLNGFPLDANGNLQAGANVESGTGLEPVRINRFATAALGTSTISLGANLDANTALAGTVTTDISFFDTLGGQRTMTMTWTRSDVSANTWTVTPTVNSGAVAASTGAFPITVDFDGAGALQTVAFAGGASVTAAGATATLDLVYNGTANGASSAQTISFNFGTIGLTNGVTGFASGYDVSFINQNGAAPAAVDSVAVNENGIVTATFGNGQTRNLYQLALADFANPNGLAAKDGNAFQVTQQSGSGVYSLANSGSVGRLTGSALESSTVDIAEEFSNMIVTQQAYNAATRVVTTTDEMLTEVVNIKR